MAEYRPPSEAVLSYLRTNAVPLGKKETFTPLLKRVGEVRVVLLGSESHGTNEYYKQMAAISKRLIQEKNFTTIAIEWDFPDTLRINRYVTDTPNAGTSVREILGSLGRFPKWMWGNEEIVKFIEWVKEENQRRSAQGKTPVEFFGLDISNSPKPAVLYQPATSFHQEQANRAAHAAAEFSQTTDDIKSWNIRKNHMHDSIKRILDHKGEESKIIIFAHNVLIGDARVTNRNKLSLTQLFKENKGEEAVIALCMQSHTGTVFAASPGDTSEQHGSGIKPINLEAALASWQEVFARAIPNTNYVVIFDESTQEANSVFRERRSQRAIGVWYDSTQPVLIETDIFNCYDGVLHLDETSAITPLP